VKFAFKRFDEENEEIILFFNCKSSVALLHLGVNVFFLEF